MKQTKNYGLHKADQDEYYDINITNENLDKIDEKMGEQSEAINQKGDVIKYDPITKKMKLMRGDILLSEAKISDATKKNAGIVKPADGLTVAEDGTLKVNIDGATLTMDQVNNVIKLADTLKDAINGAFPAANVANNQITTVEGFALDARQANPNIDGTLAKQISDLNGSLKKIELTRYNIEGIDTSGVQCFVKNNIAYVNIGVYYRTKEAITGWTKIVSNLPIPAYTKNTFIHYSQNDDGDFIAGILLNGNGELMIEGGRLSYTKFICSLISYPIK